MQNYHVLHESILTLLRNSLHEANIKYMNNICTVFKIPAILKPPGILPFLRKIYIPKVKV